MLEPLDRLVYRDLVRRALAEDIGSGDVTTGAIVPPHTHARATIGAKATCVVAGLEVVAEVFHQMDARLQFVRVRQDGDLCQPDDVLAEVSGSAASILSAERTALNFVQHLSGIATLTRRFVDAAHRTVTILDTRKTIPTMRALAKYAVRCGGGTNHRIGLYDSVLIKDNHIRIAGSVIEAVRRVQTAGLKGPIEVETQSLDEVDQAIEAGADVIMLDNLDDPTMREAIRRIAGRARVEISGGVTRDVLLFLAAIGADCVSIGALTHSAAAADISLEIETDGR
jgi:nicotinate-nucleotide pyrophosphorylase (carboxylating)